MTMATTIEQQVALDEDFVPSTKRLRIGRSNFRLPSDIQSKESTLQVVYDVLRQSPFFKAFLVTADVPEIYMHEFWATAYVHQHSIRFKMDTRKNIVDLEAFKEMLHISPRVVSRHQNTQQYSVILPIELTTEDTRNTKAYKEYYACATGEAAPKPKASARRKTGGFTSSTTPPTPIATPTVITTVVATPRLTATAKGKQQARATSPTDPSDVERTEAEQLKIVLRRSRQETYISQQGGSSTNEGTGFKPGVSDVPSDDSEEEISWNSSDDEDVDDQTKGSDDNEGEKTDESDDDDDDDDQDEAEKVNDDEEEKSKINEQEATESGEGNDEDTESDEVSEEEETREEEEESFDPIPRTPENSEDEGNGEEDQGLRISEEEGMQKEEEVDELYHDVDINQGRGLQVSQVIDDSHVTLTLVHSDGQESSSTSSFVTSLLNPITDPDRVKSLEVNFSKFMRTNQSPEAVSNMPDEQQNLYKALVEAYEADKTILDSYRESAILKRRREEDDDQEGPSVGSDRGSKRRRDGGEHASASTPSEPATRSAGRSTIGTQSRQMSASEFAFAEEPMQTTCQMEEPSHLVFETGAEDQPIVQTSQHPEWFSQTRKPPTPDRDWNKTLPAVQGSAQSWISVLAKQADAHSSFNELLDTPIDFSNFIMNRLGIDTLTPKLLAGPTYELMRGSCNSLIELEYHLEEVYKATTD
uniref:Uncharacterized protein n=1 Tax=Tanacetum cinerariifolium TaxID=118510 RepID=A0A699JGY5_TANCI|nr:hypothetical protein [Tanacetum cinerariifolium]